MLFSYTNASEHILPPRARRFVDTTQKVTSPSGIVLGQEALDAYLESSGVGKEVESLISAVTDAASQERVDAEVRRRVVTGRIPEEVAQAITEIVEVLGLHRQEMTIAEIPLVAMLYTDVPLKQDAVVVNIMGSKQLADAVRLLWSKVYMSPYPSDTVKSAIAIFRMPPADCTASAQITDDGIIIRAVRGWGRLVGADEVCDVFTFSKDLQLQDVKINDQDSMVFRNPRTGELVKSTPPDSAGQKITDEQARQIAMNLKKSQESAAIFALGKDKQWLLGFPVRSKPLGNEIKEPESEPKPTPKQSEIVPKPGPEVAPEPEEVQEDVSIEIVDLEEQEEPTQSEEASPEPEPEVAREPEEVLEYVEPEDPSVEIFEDEDSETEDEDSDEPEEHSSSKSLQYAQQHATALIEHAIKTIELTMREWLYDDDQPEDFTELVQLVSQKRQIPYKNRILSLHEMHSQNGFEDPSAENISFAFETMHRFVREF